MKNVEVILYQLGNGKNTVQLSGQSGWKVEAVACNLWMNVAVKWNPLS